MVGKLKLIQLWTREVEAFLLDVVMGKRHGPLASVARVVLWGCSKIFAAAVRVRRALYGHGN